MAAITSAATGNWSVGATWVGGVAPVAADSVTIANTHVITVDDTARACTTIALTGTLSASRTASCKLAYSGTITINSTGNLDWGTEASPIPASYVATLEPASGIGITQNSASYGGKITFRGDSGRTAWTTVTTASLTAPVVALATGWAVGDELLFVPASATNNNANHIEIVTLSGSYTPGSTTLAFTSPLAQTHIAGGRVSNLTRNCVVESAGGVNAGPITIRIDANVNAALSTYLRWARFKNCGNSGTTGAIIISSQVNITTLAQYSGSSRVIDDIASCVFYRTITSDDTPALYMTANRQYFPITNSTFISTTGVASTLVSVANTDFTDCNFASSSEIVSIYTRASVSITATRCWFAGSGASGGTGAFASGAGGAPIRLTDCIFSGRFYSVFTSNSVGNIIDSKSDWGSTYGLYLADKLIGASAAPGGFTKFESTGSKFNTYTDVFNVAGFTLASSSSTAQLFNKSNNTATQEWYTPQCRFSRDVATVKSSTSSLKAEKTTVDNLAQSYTFKVLAKSGETLHIVGQLQKNAAYGSSTRPSVTVSGLGVVAVSPSSSTTYTMTDVNGTWEVFDMYFSQSSGTDGLLDVTFTVQSTSATAVAYLSGVPIAPFVSRARHYGYLFDETLPTRTVNITTSASEATANAYTGMTVTWGASASSISAVSADNTFQKLYDYTQAQGCLNIASAMPVTGVGVAGAPSLFAVGNVTINAGFKINGAGSIGMGTYLLSTELAGPIAYTYTGGTWSQLTTVPTVNGGQLNLGAAATITLVMGGSTIFSMTPTAPSTYNMGGSTFTGTVDLRNAAAHAITVQLPSGTAYTTANNVGGVITVTVPALYQSVTISGLVANSRVQIYDTTHSTELSNAVVAGTSTTWTDSVAAASNRAIRVRISLQATVTAKNFIEANIGTCGTTAGTKDISYLASQTADTSYNTNAIDGSTVTGIIIAPSPARVAINLAGGSTTWPRIYAYQVYWLYTATGIADEAAFISSPDTANYLLTNFSLKNTNAAPLTITGGYGRDSVTGLVSTIIDTAASTGNIYPAPDHAIPYSSGSGLTAGQAAQLTAVESKTNGLNYTGTAVKADVLYVKSQLISGVGTAADPWKP